MNTPVKSSWLLDEVIKEDRFVLELLLRSAGECPVQCADTLRAAAQPRSQQRPMRCGELR